MISSSRSIKKYKTLNTIYREDVVAKFRSLPTPIDRASLVVGGLQQACKAHRPILISEDFQLHSFHTLLGQPSVLPFPVGFKFSSMSSVGLKRAREESNVVVGMEKQQCRETTEERLVVLSYADLQNGADLSAKIEAAFGQQGLGILAVEGVPDLEAKRGALLPLAPKFAALPDDVKAKYEHPQSFWSFGWSHGKEKLQGRPDFAKGSYYANPCENEPFTDPDIIKEWMSFAHPNIWPTEELPELEGAFMGLGQTIVSVGMLVAEQCDKFVESKSKDYERGKLRRVLGASKVTKARLLHYFPREVAARVRTDSLLSDNVAAGPLEGFRGRSGSFSIDSDGEAETKHEKEAHFQKNKQEVEDTDFSSWCGWHNDHGSLTGLCPAMYFREAGFMSPTDKVNILPGSPDPLAGLYIRSRNGKLHHIKAPTTAHLLFQIGETSQIHTGGLLQATPHAVRGASIPGVSRAAFAVFMEPNWGGDMQSPADRKPEEAQSSTAEAALPAGVPSLKSRWGTPDCPFTTCNFGDFTKATLGALH